jgi:hypothetical protein
VGVPNGEFQYLNKYAFDHTGRLNLSHTCEPSGGSNILPLLKVPSVPVLVDGLVGNKLDSISFLFWSILIQLFTT